MSPISSHSLPDSLSKFLFTNKRHEDVQATAVDPPQPARTAYHLDHGVWGAADRVKNESGISANNMGDFIIGSFPIALKVYH